MCLEGAACWPALCNTWPDCGSRNVVAPHHMAPACDRRLQVAAATGLRHVNVGDLVKREQLHNGWDDEFECLVIDEDKVGRSWPQLGAEGAPAVRPAQGRPDAAWRCGARSCRSSACRYLRLCVVLPGLAAPLCLRRLLNLVPPVLLPVLPLTRCATHWRT